MLLSLLLSSCIQADAQGGDHFLPTHSVSCCICMVLPARKPYYFALSLEGVECSTQGFFWSTPLTFSSCISFCQLLWNLCVIHPQCMAIISPSSAPYNSGYVPLFTHFSYFFVSFKFIPSYIHNFTQTFIFKGDQFFFYSFCTVPAFTSVTKRGDDI